MIKKLNTIIFAIFVMLFSLSASANDNVNIKAGFAVDMGFGATALINDQFGIMIGNDGVAADYLFKKGGFSTDVPFTWYVAGGGYAEWDDGLGVRLPLGLNLNFERNWNAYAQVAPDIDFDDDDDDVEFGAQLAAGLRYSF